MAKTLRVEDSALSAYTDEIRRRDYAVLARQWNESGGEWIRYGVQLARALELGRKSPNIIEEWVPGDSPYWQN